MAYYFKHKEHTGGEIEYLGDSETEAFASLQDEYDLSLEEILEVCLKEFVFERKETV